ncbi:MAG: penicillin-binding protein [Melioribacter sp.]|nr:penicillin-binding protein [Melioribacter sp.]
MLKKILIILFSSLIILFISTWFSLPGLSDIKRDFYARKSPSKTIYLDRYDNELSVDSYGDIIYLKLEDVPAYVINDLVFFEDKSFWDNAGVSINGILHGIFSFGEVGGSSITQQFWRDFINWKERTILRKWVEIVGSIKLSMTMDKRDILEGYINNTAYFHTRNLKGLDAGARYWFGKPASSLTRSEGIMLIAMLNKKPSTLEKLYSKYQSRVSRLIDAGSLTKDDPDYEDILRGSELKRSFAEPQSYSTFIDNVTEKILENNELAKNYFASGLKIKTTLDKLGNDLIYKQINDFAAARKVNNITFLMFNPNQELIYNVKYPKSFKGYLDLANSPNIMPASRAKVICYAAAIEELVNRGYSVKDILDYPLPTAYKYSSGKVIKDNYKTKTVSLEIAITLSLNAPALYAANKITTPSKICELASNFDIHWKPYESLPLGTQGTSEINLLSFFHSLFVNESRMKEPFLFTEAVANNGNEQFSLEGNNISSNLLKNETIYILKECLKNVVLNGTAKELKESSLLDSWEIAVKTGTSNNGKHIGITGVIGKYSFSLLAETKVNIGSSGILTFLLRKILEQLAYNGFITKEKVNEYYSVSNSSNSRNF